jgi:hypothetical protein
MRCRGFLFAEGDEFFTSLLRSKGGDESEATLYKGIKQQNVMCEEDAN